MTTNLDSVFGDADGVDPEGGAIELTDDLSRVLRLPQRDAMALAVQIAGPLSRRLKTPAGTMTLRPLQALALAEAHDLRGLIALLPVGEGKTLITMLLSVVLQAERPVLIVPAKLEDKTDREFAALAKHWQQHRTLQIISYELISRRPELLDELAPDLIICDEVHKLKNPKAACTKRVWRYIRTREPGPPTFIGLSGTIATRSFKEWWHLQQWALPPLCQPLPYSYIVMQSWAQALDEKVTARRPTGQLWRLVDERAPSATMPEIRSAFGKLVRGTPGIITADGSDVAASLQIERVELRVPAIDEALEAMRRTWCTPGGEEFSEAADLWRHARELGNGFYYRWSPAPPKWWLEPRKDFHAYVRSVLSGSRTLDTMAQVVARDGGSEPAIDAWYAVKDKFKPNPVPVWISDDVIDYAIEWAKDTSGLVWVEHRAVGAQLYARGLPYFGEQGRSPIGRVIDQHTGAAAVSSLAVSEGFNLQAWSSNLVLNATPMGARYEQLLGRTHRYGQTADTVTCQLLFCALEQRDGFEQACADALYIQQTTGQRQKLCFADHI